MSFININLYFAEERPSPTWRRMIETERDKLGINRWARKTTIAKDKEKWRQHIWGLMRHPSRVKRIGRSVSSEESPLKF